MSWLSSLTTTEIVIIVIFFVYLLASGIGFTLLYVTGQGYMDLAKGLRRILEREESAGRLDDTQALAEEISNYYESYVKYNPAIHQRYASIINWIDDILLQTNMIKKRNKYGIWFDEYYEALKKVQQHYGSKYPFYRCTSNQAQILEDIRSLTSGADEGSAAALLRKTEDEFIRLTKEGIKNERVNYVSVAIGVAGILVSVLLTVLQMFG